MLLEVPEIGFGIHFGGVLGPVLRSSQMVLCGNSKIAASDCFSSGISNSSHGKNKQTVQYILRKSTMTP